MLSKTELGDSPTFDVNEFKARLERARKALLEAEEYIYSWQEIEDRKRSAKETEFQN